MIAFLSLFDQKPQINNKTVEFKKALNLLSKKSEGLLRQKKIHFNF
ncbi:hypothetical protein ABIB40_003165 [Pedobacter sp. UYP30]